MGELGGKNPQTFLDLKKNFYEMPGPVYQVAVTEEISLALTLGFV